MNKTIDSAFTKFKELQMPAQTNLTKGQMKKIEQEFTNRMRTKWVKYYKHWRDFDLLTCILAMIGLGLYMVEVSVFLPIIPHILTLSLLIV